MPLISIADVADRRLDPFRALKRTNETARAGLFIAEGDKLVERLLTSSLAVRSLLLSEPYVDRFAAQIPADVPTYVVADEAIEGLVGFNFHRGVLACGVRPRPPRLAELLTEPAALVVVCPDVQDPENLGAIVRLAAGFAATALVLGPHCADPFSRRVQRVSMGNVYRTPIVPTDDVVALLAELRSSYGVESWATVLDADAETFDPTRKPRRLAIAFGSGGHGLGREVIDACDRKVTIPMPPTVDSLNVAVAAGIFLYELSRASSREGG